MSSVYAHETEKIYPPIYPATAPPDDDESQAYRLRKIDELERFLRSEVDSRDKLTKRFKRRATATSISDTAVIAAITTLEATSIATLITGIGIPISVVLASTGLFLGLGSAIIHKTRRIFDSKAKKHEKIKTLAESKLDSISGLVSKAVEDAHVSHEEYQLILKEVEHYRKMKEEIRSKSKKTTDSITAEQREEILKQGREEGQKAFLEKIAASSGIPTCRVSRKLRTDRLPMKICEELTSSQMHFSTSQLTVSHPLVVAIVVAKSDSSETDIVSFDIHALFQENL